MFWVRKRTVSLKKKKMVYNANYRLMQVKSIAECSPLEHSSILSTFIKLPFGIKIFVLSIFERPFYTGFTVIKSSMLIYASAGRMECHCVRFTQTS